MRTRRARWRYAVWACAFAVPIGLAALVSLPFVSAAAPLATPSPAMSAEGAPSPPAPEATELPPVAMESAPPPPPAAPALPDPLRPECPGSTTMSIWAHYDDDLLFAGTRISDALAAGNCVRTVFLTGGDAGRGADYRAGREMGIEHAYDAMRGSSGGWTRTSAVLPTGAVVTISSPADDPRISLVFLGLPDGNLGGEGFAATGWVSLAKLAAGKIDHLHDVSGSYGLGWTGIVDSLRILIGGFAPASIITHVPGSAHAWSEGDHADHAITGILAREAWQGSGLDQSVMGYAVGYQTAWRPANVAGDALWKKIAAFQAYAAGDAVTASCRNVDTCLALPKFGAWLQREYILSEAEIAGG